MPIGLVNHGTDNAFDNGLQLKAAPKYSISRGEDDTLQWDPPIRSRELANALSYHYPLDQSLQEKMQHAILDFLEAEIPDSAPALEKTEASLGLSSNAQSKETVTATSEGGSVTINSPGIATAQQQSTQSPEIFGVVWDMKTGVSVKPKGRKRALSPATRQRVAENRGNTCAYHRKAKTQCDPTQCRQNRLYPWTAIDSKKVEGGDQKKRDANSTTDAKYEDHPLKRMKGLVELSSNHLENVRHSPNDVIWHGTSSKPSLDVEKAPSSVNSVSITHDYWMNSRPLHSTKGTIADLAGTIIGSSPDFERIQGGTKLFALSEDIDINLELDPATMGQYSFENDIFLQQNWSSAAEAPGMDNFDWIEDLMASDLPSLEYDWPREELSATATLTDSSSSPNAFYDSSYSMPGTDDLPGDVQNCSLATRQDPQFENFEQSSGGAQDYVYAIRDVLDENALAEFVPSSFLGSSLAVETTRTMVSRAPRARMPVSAIVPATPMGTAVEQMAAKKMPRAGKLFKPSAVGRSGHRINVESSLGAPTSAVLQNDCAEPAFNRSCKLTKSPTTERPGPISSHGALSLPVSRLSTDLISNRRISAPRPCYMRSSAEQPLGEPLKTLHSNTQPTVIQEAQDSVPANLTPKFSSRPLFVKDVDRIRARPPPSPLSDSLPPSPRISRPLPPPVPSLTSSYANQPPRASQMQSPDRPQQKSFLSASPSFYQRTCGVGFNPDASSIRASELLSTSGHGTTRSLRLRSGRQVAEVVKRKISGVEEDINEQTLARRLSRPISEMDVMSIDNLSNLLRDSSLVLTRTLEQVYLPKDGPSLLDIVLLDKGDPASFPKAVAPSLNLEILLEVLETSKSRARVLKSTCGIEVQASSPQTTAEHLFPDSTAPVSRISSPANKMYDDTDADPFVSLQLGYIKSISDQISTATTTDVNVERQLTVIYLSKATDTVVRRGMISPIKASEAPKLSPSHSLRWLDPTWRTIESVISGLHASEDLSPRSVGAIKSTSPDPLNSHLLTKLSKIRSRKLTARGSGAIKSTSSDLHNSSLLARSSEMESGSSSQTSRNSVPDGKESKAKECLDSVPDVTELAAEYLDLHPHDIKASRATESSPTDSDSVQDNTTTTKELEAKEEEEPPQSYDVDSISFWQPAVAEHQASLKIEKAVEHARRRNRSAFAVLVETSTDAVKGLWEKLMDLKL